MKIERKQIDNEQSKVKMEGLKQENDDSKDITENIWKIGTHIQVIILIIMINVNMLSSYVDALSAKFIQSNKKEIIVILINYNTRDIFII